MSIDPAETVALNPHRRDRAARIQAKLDALLATVVYGDLFDFALTASEIHRYLIGVPATTDEVGSLLSESHSHHLPVSVQHSFVTLRGRESLILTRKRREMAASTLWQQALNFRPLLARLPFIRMAAVTGTLAMNNAEADSDIDLFIVTTPGRLWLARAFIIGVVRLAALRGVTLCPNYLVTERALAVSDRNIFTAHELAQMVPILGLHTYRQMMSANRWMLDYLPNATEHTARLNADSEQPPRVKSTAEILFARTAFDRVENWEMRRKSARFSAMKSSAGISEADFSPDWCKGHFEGHRQHTLHSYQDRLQSLGIEGVLSFAS